jgi:Na+/proline symporter
MILNAVDWMIVIAFFVFSLAIGIAVSRRAGKSASEFFLSGRNMPWWLLGISMVATTFSSDTPNLVTDIVRQNGVAGNWLWWAFLLTGMLTVFVYAKLWRRSGAMTDLEFYEMRYSGKTAAFLRGFRAIYLGIIFNVIIMAAVSLAMIKIAGVMLRWTPLQTILIASVITVIYSALGGLRGVLITDFFQFFLAMAGAFGAAVVVVNLPQVGGLTSLLSHESVINKISLLPDFDDTSMVVSLLVLPLAVQWWSVWYPGAEPGGGGYIVQRMLSAKSENHSVGATLLFNVAHYALRPWPWILVALTSLVVFPDLESLRASFPHIDSAVVKNDLAYPAMLTLLPHGLMGLVIASLIAAYMSTISTHLNWGSSYIVNDVYRRFVNPDATEKRLVVVGRLSTVLLMLIAGIFTLLLENALQAFHILLQIGAGTGLLFILRWFWWRINAFSEISAMTVSFLIALYLKFVHPYTGLPLLSTGTELCLGVAITTIAWIGVTMITQPADEETLRKFYRLVKPGGPGWKQVVEQAQQDNDPVEDENRRWEVPLGILCMVFGCLAVYSTLFATGNWLYGNDVLAFVLSVVALISGAFLIKFWKKIRGVAEQQ